ncbi:MAG: hypothetical protein M1837_007462 [Sclerophora amabilis]|nr:MAG: hypothetical protein M1837_007462 [Sclerophora amabilis]
MARFTLLPLIFGNLALAVQPVEMRGSDFVVASTGDRFQMIGVAYQPGGASGFDPSSREDPLSDGDVCLRDAALMQRLGLNTIRVYNLDPSLNHDLCVSIFNNVGIYMVLDVNSPLDGESLSRSDPETTYTPDYLDRIFRIVEAFKNYPNLLAFVGGNEVINDVPSSSTVPPYLRAVNRDLKDYIAKNANRAIPVGYSAADVREILSDTWQYLQCAIDGDSNDQSRADFFGLNSYSWCGDATFESSGYDVLVDQFSNTTIPVFFSEYGCNESPPRRFDEVQAVYGPRMTPVLSGGLIYEYSQEPSNYGLVTINEDGSVRLRGDYDNLQRQYNKLNITLLESSNATATALKPPKCDASLITSEEFSADFNIPKIPRGGRQLIDNGVSKPNIGKLVPVTKTEVSQKVQGSNGKTISELAIKPLPDSESNTPSGEDTSDGDSGSTPSAATPSPTSGTTSSPAPTNTGAASSSKTTNGVLFLVWFTFVALELSRLF